MQSGRDLRSRESSFIMNTNSPHIVVSVSGPTSAEKPRKKYCTIALGYEMFERWRNIRKKLGLKSDDQLARYLLSKENKGKTNNSSNTSAVTRDNAPHTYGTADPATNCSWTNNTNKAETTLNATSQDEEVERMVIDVDPLVLDALQGDD